MAMETERLTAKQERAIIALLNEASVKRAAETAKVGHRTLCRWLLDDRFKRAYREARREAFSHAIALTQHYAPMAVQTLASQPSRVGSAERATGTLLWKSGPAR